MSHRVSGLHGDGATPLREAAVNLRLCGSNPERRLSSSAVRRRTVGSELPPSCRRGGRRRDVAARREARAAGGGGRARPPPLLQDSPVRAAGSDRLSDTGTRGNFAGPTRSRNAAPPAGPGAGVTAHPHSREEAADTNKHLVTACPSGRGHVLVNRGSGAEMGADTRPGDRAESQGRAWQREARHQRRVHHHPAGEGEILDLRGGEDHGAGVEGGVHV